jgi:hypothetical protein
MPLANSNGPRWIRDQNVSVDKRLRGIGPIRTFLARLFGRTPAAPGPAEVRAPGPPVPAVDSESREA